LRPPQDWRAAPVTLAIAVVTVAAWLLALAFGRLDLLAVAGGFIPARVGGVAGEALPVPVWLTPLTATLVHGNFLHLAFNLLILLFCGRTTEAILGSRGFLFLYLVGAYAAALAQWAPDPRAISPMIGASGAISAVLGAYALLFGRNRVKVSSPALAALLHALWLAAAWIGIQILIGMTFVVPGARIAIAAHIGGFLAGLLLAKPLLLLKWRGA
jgi:membrane associated rhomboid family serine protease